MNGSLLKQPKAVWAVTFACVVAFMGIGLVDPILPAIAKDLDAGPSQVELLFTSYFLITAVAMLVTGFVSSRIGPKRTLLTGLFLVVVFSAAAGASGSIGQIVGFRAGWGLGNALFIATALSVIVGAASGGVGGAIILYEAALGLGIASGPLLGGELGAISWRGPFFGTAVLMAIGFVAIVVALDKVPQPARRTGITEPLRALGHRGLLTLGLTAFFYNFGFFTLLAYTPFPLGLDAHGLGYVFFGWGLLLAISSVFVAPRLERRFGMVRTMYPVLLLFALDLLAMAILTNSQLALILLVIAAGALLGVNNTLVTEAVMKVSPVERPVASAAYSFIRFFGGAAAPWIAGHLAESFSPHVPYYVGAGAVVIAVGVLATGHSLLRRLDREEPPELVVPAAAPQPPRRALLPAERILVAVDCSPQSAIVADAAGELARSRHAALELVHVREIDVVGGEDAVERESADEARQTLAARIEQLRDEGVDVSGRLVEVTGDHRAVADAIITRAAESHADVIVVGPPSANGLGARLAGSVVDEVGRRASSHVLIVNPAAATAAPEPALPG